MKNVKLLLTTTVDNLGIVGDVVTVKPGFARNFLVPQGLATEPTKGNIERLAEERARVTEELSRQRAEQEELIKKLEGFEITIQRSANEQGVLFGGVSQHDIADLLREEGFRIDDRAVRIGDQVKRLDSYEIPIVLTNDLKTEIKLWITSDKPVDQLQAEEDEQEQADENESSTEDAAPAARTDSEQS